MDAIIGMSGFFAASSGLWILAVLIVAFLIGGVLMSVFGGVFYWLHRMAKKASARYDL